MKRDFIIIVGSIIRQLCIGIILKQEKIEVFVSKRGSESCIWKKMYFLLVCGMSVKKEFCLRYGTEKIKDCF